MDKIALVTGAGRGIGRAVALGLAQDGYTVALAGRSPEPLAQAAEAIAQGGGRALAVPADVRSEEAVDALFARIRDEFGRLDLLFNNAGIFTPGLEIDALTVAQWRDVVDTNLNGAFLCARGAYALMKAQTPRGGRIINNGSISAHAPRPRSVGYTTTKHALTGLTRSLSLDGRAHDIACGQIDIGNAATDMADHMAQGIAQADGRIAAEPLMDVRHVVDAVRYMAGLPLSANVQFMTVMATKMPFIGRG
ncbi:SDR family oxidoreductase [Pigmentiphaga soli]|uniref:SDR family oxidoreductase n=1 Tax=Pigmentiphaga soli TaxID=1007095 RepID=A0ABP8GK84_9BURK